MNLATLLSFSRIPLLFVVLIGLMTPVPGMATLALLAFVLAVITDWLDGVAARAKNEVTPLGTLLDPLIDKIFLLGLFIYFLTVGIIPHWGLLPLVAMMAREFIITGLRQCALVHQKVLPADSQGKLKTVLQFFSLFLLVLVPFLQRDMGSTPTVMAWADFFKFFGRCTFGLAAILTVTSGIHYLYKYRDYWKAGRPDRTSGVSL